MKALALWRIGSAALLAAATPTAHAAGVACQQDCAGGACQQAACAWSSAGTGTCDCRSGALPWGASTFAAYCRQWGSPGPSCYQPAPYQNPTSSSLPSPAPQITNAPVMTTALASQSPYVATLVEAMRNGDNWAVGPVRGIIHDSHLDTATGLVTHTAAISFVGQVVTTAAGSAQIAVTVSGDITQLTWLKAATDALVTGAIQPVSFQGTVTAGGLHGSLLVAGSGGQSQTIQW
jgi:hypothetical protein